MKDLKHTPGPWKVMYSTPENETKSDLAVWPAFVNEGDIGSPVCKVSPFAQENETDRANAKLIAAAPDLLEALIDLLNVDPINSMAVFAAENKALSAIGKATANGIVSTLKTPEA